ncbi:MAG: endosialidase [Defluviitaleaceae bacterium]|nr:endosialidase [Defluviitaleaceae bacterium]
MAIISKGIIVNNNSMSFGNYKATDKIKVDDFEHNGNIYLVRTHKDVTRLVKNGELLCETVPGATVHNFSVDDKICRFEIEGIGNCQITLCLEPLVEYTLKIGDDRPIALTNNASGKITFSISLNEKTAQRVEIQKAEEAKEA